ncbi:MAG: fibronectin type III domain-containing protein [Deltaproteobacteria bacterium]|nr:fibronectin type III domain-containing protein [Deltaproteobacteria bacterium]
MRRILTIIFFLLSPFTAGAAHLDLAWSPNEEPDLAGYRVYYGTSSGQYAGCLDAGKTNSFRLENLLDGTRYFVTITAYDKAGNESGFSREVSAIAYSDEDQDDPFRQPEGGGGGGCFVSILASDFQRDRNR